MCLALEHLLHRIPVNGTYHLLLVIAFLTEVIDKNLRQLYAVALARAEVHLNDVTVYAVEQLFDEFCTDLVTGYVKRKRVDAFVENVKSLGVCLLCIGSIYILTYVPGIIILLVATHKRKFTRKGIGGVELFHILAAVKRLNTEPFWGTPDKTLLEISAFQVHLNLVKPFLGGRSIELRKKFFVIVVHIET